MNKTFDIVVAKEFETNQGGKSEKRTVWNKVGKAWPSKNSDSISFELFFLPNVRYVLSLRSLAQEKTQVLDMEAQVGGEHE